MDNNKTELKNAVKILETKCKQTGEKTDTEHQITTKITENELKKTTETTETVRQETGDKTETERLKTRVKTETWRLKTGETPDSDHKTTGDKTQTKQRKTAEKTKTEQRQTAGKTGTESQKTRERAVPQTTGEIPDIEYQKLESGYQNVLTTHVVASGVSVLGGLIGIVGASIDMRTNGYQATFSGRGITLGITALAAGSLVTYFTSIQKARSGNQMYRLGVSEMQQEICETNKCVASLQKSVNNLTDVEQKLFTAQEHIYEEIRIVKEENIQRLVEIQNCLHKIQIDLEKVRDKANMTVNQPTIFNVDHSSVIRRTISDRGYVSVPLSPLKEAAANALDYAAVFEENQRSPEAQGRTIDPPESNVPCKGAEEKPPGMISAVSRQIKKETLKPPFHLKKTLTKLSSATNAVVVYWLIRSVEEGSACVARVAAGLILFDHWVNQLNTFVESACELYDQ